MRRMWTRAVILGALGLTAGGAIGCATERAPINRVQPNALEKSFFVGKNLADPLDDPEFYAQGTVVDVGYGAAQDGLFTSTYAQPVSRIKWQITEHMLIGRLSYERISDSDHKGAGPTSSDGVVAVAYPIASHFDIKRDYNPATGEESNVVGENSSDRPWYERQYMRVDWSKNLNVDSYDFDTLSMLGVFGGVTYESMDYFINDPADEDAPHFDVGGGYFDVTNKAFARPQMIDLSALGWGAGKFPACFLDNDILHGSAPAGTCNPVEITIRQAFKRVVDHDYEPVEWDGYRFQAYGIFTAERHGYSRDYGMTDQAWHRFADRYNIWEQSHYYDQSGSPVPCYTPDTLGYGADPHADANADGTEDACQAVADATGLTGSKCDTFKQRCTLPYRARQEKSIAWYYTKGSNPEFFEGTEWATHEWDVAMRGAVVSAKYAECVRGGGTDCATQYPMYDGQMQENWDARELAREVDDCRHKIAYTDLNANEAACQGLADSVGAARGYSAGVIALAKMPEMVVLCHSPVEHNDPAVCAPADKRLPVGVTMAQCDQAEHDRLDPSKDQSVVASMLATCNAAVTARRGDMRFNQINALVAPQTPSPWGIMTDSDDPLTGEKIATSVNVWTHVNDLWSQSVIDNLRYLNGELKTADVTEGTYIHNWAQAADAAKRTGAVGMVTAEDYKRRMAEFSGVDPKTFEALAAKKIDPNTQARLDELTAKVSTIAAATGVPTTSGATYEARRKEAASHPEFEAKLVTKAMQQYAGVDGLPMSDDVLNQASPLRGANPTVQRNFQSMKELALAQRGACMLQEAPAPFSMVGLSDVLQEKFGAFNPADGPDAQQARAERMRRFIAQRAQYAVIAHEMGHSIGLRHNFISSYDAWGFRPQYWQLRTNDGEVKTLCKDVSADGEACVGPRYFDPVTKNERDNLIWMFMQSSIMDYAGEGTQDLVGIGAYDYAAARMFYGDVVAVHKDASYNSNTARGKGMIAQTDNFGGIIGLQNKYGAQTIHYSDLQNKYELIKNCKTVDPMAYKPAGWNVDRDGEWHPTLDGQIVKVKGNYTRCEEQKVDYQQWTALRLPQGSEAPNFYRGGAAVDPQGRTRVPYGFATDSWADLGNLSVYRHDNGADPYELFNFLISQQEINHIFDNYRRGRASFSIRASADRTLSRYNTKMRDGAKGLGLIANNVRNIAEQTNGNFNELWPMYISQLNWTDNIFASGIAFDHFARQLARPEPGNHIAIPGDPVLRSADVSYAQGSTKITIPNGATGYFDNGGDNIGLGGKPLENALSDNHGEYDRDYTLNCGSYYDKAFTSMLLTESEDNFISSNAEDFLDARFRSVSMADLFRDGYRRWLANNLTGDDFIKGARVAADANGNPLVKKEGANKWPAQPIGWTSWWMPSGPVSCFPAAGTTACYGYNDADPNMNPLKPNVPANVAVIDPQVGWEQQKFLIAWTLNYLPENAQQYWLDRMRVYQLGVDADPGYSNRIEFHDPYGKVFVAQTYGKENIFGKTVQQGIGARVLEWANQLAAKAYVDDHTAPDLDGDGNPDWVVPSFANGQAVVKFDPAVGTSNNCNENDNSGCACEANMACVTLSKYTEVLFYLREAMDAYGFGSPHEKGVY